MSLNIQDAVREVDKLYDWTGIREGGFRFSAADVFAQGYDGESWRFHITIGKTASEAYAKLRQEIPTGADRKASLERRAAELLAEANAIEATKP